jgi:hypothetical protein
MFPPIPPFNEPMVEREEIIYQKKGIRPGGSEPARDKLRDVRWFAWAGSRIDFIAHRLAAISQLTGVFAGI